MALAHKDDIARVNAEHPDWTARQIAEHLNIERHHVYNVARAYDLKLAPSPVAPPNRLPAVQTAAPAEVLEPDDVGVEQPPDFTIMASSPKGMEQAQAELLLWAGQKIEAERGMLTEIEQQITIAVENGWASDGWNRQYRIAKHRVEYYRKIKAALEAGYYIVPPFPLDIFAIRTDRSKPRGLSEGYRSEHVQSARLLPVGEGRYVSDRPTVAQDEYETGQVRDGKPLTRMDYWADEFRAVDFPFKLAKPAILNATAQAMALKVFDQMGCLPARRGRADPIVCGQILVPGKHRWNPPITFFVAWWLDTSTL